MGNNKQKGAQAVEFALVLPLLLLVIFAVVDFGILVYDKAIITNASREAVRRGIILKPAVAWDPASIRQVACNHARSALITVSTGTRNATCTGTADPNIQVFTGVNAICPNPSGTTTPDFGDPVAVIISYPVSGFTLGAFGTLGSAFSTIGSSVTLVSCTQMNHE